MNRMRLLILALCALSPLRAEVADLVIFSYDRPLQLYALLESIEKHVKGVGVTTVVCRASNIAYKGAYSVVGKEFPQVKFMMQEGNPPQDFKSLTLQAIFDTPAGYVIFAVDDIVVKDDVDLSKCIEILDRTDAYGFYLRMGDHLNYCYTMDQAQRLPELASVQDDILSWKFVGSECDWAYPHTVDMTVYRKRSLNSFRDLSYHSPNSLEGCWASQAGPAMELRGLCFKDSKIVNLPLNKVQKELENRSMGISASALLMRFLQGYKLALDPLNKIRNASAHMEYEPTFVLRTSAEQPKSNPVAAEAAQPAVQAPKKEATRDEIKKKNELLHVLGINDLDELMGKKVKKDAAWYKTISRLEEKRIVIVTPSFKNAQWYKKNLDSVFDQRYTNWHMIYVDDCSPDGTGELVKAYVKERGFEDKVTVICNQVRRKAMANLYTAIYMCAPTDIVAIVDGDDWLAFGDVMNEINFMYTTRGVWLTYGQYKEYPSGNIGFCRDYPREVVEHNAFRSYSHGPSHLRTFYAGLFHKVRTDDLLLDGEFFPMTYDLAMMFPMIEMARDHFMFCSTPLLEYNTSNPINDHKVSRDLQQKCDRIIRSRGRYEKIENPF